LSSQLEIIARDISILDRRVERLERVENVFTIHANEVVINEAGVDVDLRIEGNVDQNLFYVNSGTDRIGIGTNTPAGKLGFFEDGGITTGIYAINDGSYCIYTNDIYSNTAWHGAYFFSRRARGTMALPAALQSTDRFFLLRASGYDGAGWVDGCAAIQIDVTENWNAAAHGSRVRIIGTQNGVVASTIVADFQAGIQVGAPVGGDKGIGTINVATDIYKNNVAYANPDYVLEHHYRGKIEKFIDNLGAKEYEGLMDLPDVDKFMDENLHLPNIHREPMGIFDRSDAVLLHLEQIYLYLIDHEKRLKEEEHGN